MTSHSVTRLEQGGITIDAAKNSVPLVAASYSHPTLGDRTIVRLIPEALVEAEDLALGVTGLEPGSRINVGHTRRRAIGFPAWPILNDPANAHHALNLVADLERGGRVAHTKPKRFKEIITELATKLDNSAPHFLPTFLEEAGRIFITVENPVFASQMFTLAREAEQRHRLPIDENRHLEAVLEFAYAGALSTKELSKEAKRLGDAMEPAEAYRTYRALCVERVRGGLLPHAGMKKELTQLATAAGLDPAHEDVTIATEMLRAFSIQRAGAHFWKNYEKAICQAAADNAAVNDRLLELAPRGLETDQWLALLHKTGAIDLVRAGKHPEFIPHILLFEAHWRKWPHKASTQLAPVLAELLPHAGLSQVPLPYDRLHYLPADVIEVIVASGIPFAFSEPFKATSVNLTEWARQLERAPLPHTAAEKSLRKELVNGIMDSLKHPEVVDTLALDPHIRPLVVELITAHVERLESGVPPVDTLERTTKFARGFELVRDPEIQALLDRIRSIHRDPAAPIAETFRRGVPDELGWPELEQVQQAYGQNKKLHLGQGASDCWPGAIVNQKSVSTYLRGTTATEVSNWTGERLYGAMEADGQFGLATYTDSDPRVWWADTPKGTPSSLKEFWGWGLNASVPVPGGRMFGEGVIMRPGPGYVGSWK